MNEKEMLQLMTLLDLLGKKVGPKHISAVYDRKKRLLEKWKEKNKKEYQVFVMGR